MNNYETVFIASPTLSDSEVKGVLSKFQGVITENGGTLVNTEEWGLKQLAYPIQKQTSGYYFLIEFEAPGSIVDIVETYFRRDENIMRFLVVKQDKYAVEYAIKRRDRLAGKAKEEKKAAETAAVEEEKKEEN